MNPIGASNPSPVIQPVPDLGRGAEIGRILLSEMVQRNDSKTYEILSLVTDLDWSMAVNDEGHTALHLAIELGHLDMARKILSTLGSAAPALAKRDRAGYTPLMMAIKAQEISLAKAIAAKAPLTESLGTCGSTGQSVFLRLRDEHAKLFIETGGDTTEALRLARRRGIEGFENCLVGPGESTRLLKLCEQGRVEEARGMVEAGVEVPLVLMRGVLGGDPSMAVADGIALRNLVLAGADVTAALRYAIATGENFAVLAIVFFLGADGEAELEACVQRRDVEATTLMLQSDFSADNLLMKKAIEDDKESVDFLLERRVETRKVLVNLARMNQSAAISLVCRYEADTTRALSWLFSQGEYEAIKRIIDAGAPTDHLVNTCLAISVLARHDGIKKLSKLIELGADTSRPLFDAVKSGDSTGAKLLLLAGARWDAACQHAVGFERVVVRRELAALAKEVDKLTAVIRQSDEHGHLDITVAEKVLSAMSHFRQPDQKAIIDDIKNYAQRLIAGGEQRIGELLNALLDVDWAAIKRCSGNRGAVDYALRFAVVNANQHMARLLNAAGAPHSPMTVRAMQENKPDYLIALAKAGWPMHQLLASVVHSGCVDLAKRMVTAINLDLLLLLKEVSKRLGDQVMKMFIPAVTDGCEELVRALGENDRSFANKLVSVGVNIHKALLVTRFSGSSIGVTQALLEMGARESYAMAHAIEGNRGWLDKVSIAGGADPRQALIYASQNGMSRAVTKLRESGVTSDVGMSMV
jgi:ankyrin repeat protein